MSLSSRLSILFLFVTNAQSSTCGILFTSSQRFDGRQSLSNLDSRCASLFESASNNFKSNLPSNVNFHFVAWLSASNSNAIDRLRAKFPFSSVFFPSCVADANNRLLSSSFSASGFYSTSLSRAPTSTETGNGAAEAKTWTNTNAAGKFVKSASDDSACQNWSTDGSGGDDDDDIPKATYGLNDKNDMGWTVDGVDTCDKRYHIYCVG